MKTKVRCADCAWCYDLRISYAGELINLCASGKEAYQYYKTVLKFECNKYNKRRGNKAKIQYKEI